MSVDQDRKSSRLGVRTRLLLGASTALPLAALSVPALGQSIVEHSDGDITVSAETASGTPVAVELATSGGSIDVAVTAVTGTADAGVRDYIVGLETLTDGSITASFATITGTGEGELLGLGADTLDGDIALEVGSVDVDGTASAGIAAHSVNGDVAIAADSVISRGTGEDSQFEFYEAVFGHSENGAVSLTVGSAETYGAYGSALVALAGTNASITADSATAHADHSATVFTRAGGSVDVQVGEIVHTSEVSGQGAYLESSGGDASLAAETIEVGSYSQGARVNGAGNVTVDVGSITGGRGLYVDPTAGNVAITVGSVDTYGYAINASTHSGGDLTLTAGSISSSIEGEGTIIANATGGGAISITVDEASGAGIDRGTIAATTDGGDIAITGGSVSASGNAGLGVFAQSTDGDIVVDLETVTTTGLEMVNEHVSEGVLALTTNGTASVSVGQAHVEGYAASAVAVVAGGGAAIEAENASSAGAQAAVLYAESANGDATIDAGTVTLRGDRQAAIQAISHGGNAVVRADTVVGEGTSGAGIYAQGSTGVEVTSGSVQAQRYGIGVSSGGDVTIETAGDTISELSNAISAFGQNVSVTTGEGTLTSGATGGIRVSADVSATVTNGGTASATSDQGSAIHVTSLGAVSIASDVVTVTGAGAWPGERSDGSGYRLEQGGIIVEGGAGPISLAANSVEVAGEHRYGVSVRGTGTIDIDVGTVTHASADSVAVVGRGGAGDVSITTGDVTTTGASGVGIYAETTSGRIVIDAGTTRVENEGQTGWFTGDAVVASSQSGSISITSDDAFSEALWGTAVAGYSGGDVSIVSGRAETTGDGGVALYASSGGGSVSVDSGAILTSGAGTAALTAVAQNGSASVRMDDITATAADALGLRAHARDASVQVDGNVSTGGMALNVISLGGVSDVTVNGSVASVNDIAISSFTQNGTVTVGEGASVEAARAAVVVTNFSPSIPGYFHVENNGSITGSTAIYVNPNQAGIVSDVTIRNNGSLSGTNGVAVFTGAGYDILELTENSVVEGIVDLGAGHDELVLDFNDGAAADAVGQVASSVNVEWLEVSTGNWRAEDTQSWYDTVEIEVGASLTVAENADGEAAIATSHVELAGQLNLELVTDTEAGELAGLLFEGTGELHLTGTATVLVDDASGLQHTGGTFVDNGTLLLTTVYGGDITTTADGTFQLGAGGLEGDFTGDLVNDGTFVYARSDSYELTGSFTGSGALIKNGAGTLTFGGFYGFLGTTTVNGGTIAFSGQLAEDTELDLSDGGTFDLSQVEGGEQTIGELGGTGGNLVLGSTNLTINQSDNTSFAGSITGNGTLTKEGEGDLKLDGDSDFSGDANVDGGTLSVNGSFQNADFYVNEGGKLGGNGTVGDTSIQGGTLGAGNSIGELTVAGDLTFTADSVLEVEVDPAGNADLINVTGTATLGNATVNVLAESGTYAPVTEYTILTAEEGISGEFGAVNTNLAYLVPLLSYTVDSVSLRLSRNDVDFSAYAETANQATVGGLIESLGFGTALYDATLVLARSQVAADFETLTGGVYPSYGALLIETADMLRRQTAPQPQAGVGAFVWSTALAGELNGEGGNGITGFRTDNTGAAGGLGYAAEGFDFTAGLGKLWQDPDRSQVSDSEVKFALAQASYNSPIGLSARAGVQFGWVDAKASRSTTLGAISATVSSAFEGEYTQYFGEIGYTLPAGAASVEPFAGISHVSLDMDRFTEVGGATALTVDGLDRDVTFADLGLRVSAQPFGGVTPYLSGAYRRAWGDRVSDATIAFTGNAAGGVITGLPIAKNAAEVEAGIRYSGGVVDLELGYTGSFSKTFDSNNVKVSASIHF